MEHEPSKVLSSQSKVNYDYTTVKVTQSRIDKGLLAIPVSLSPRFPTQNQTIQVYLGGDITSESKPYSSYTSSTRECRIGGLREWFDQNGTRDGDEIVIQFLDAPRFMYRLIPEKNFLHKTLDLETALDSTDSEQDAYKRVSDLAKWNHLDDHTVALREYLRLANSAQSSPERSYSNPTLMQQRESAPAGVRTLLAALYQGHCQVCDFWFLKRNGSPYFEIHHLDPVRGHLPQNLLLICGNCHNQFEYANVDQKFDDEWLVNVSFNGKLYVVTQAVQKIDRKEFQKKLFV